MVRSRVSLGAQLNRDTMTSAVNRFGKSMTNRLFTETKDANGRVTARTSTDTVFVGDIQFGPKIDRIYAVHGSISVGQGVLYVSANDSEGANITPTKSFIIEGAIAGTFDAWEVLEQIRTPTYAGPDITHYEFRCVRRNTVTLT